MANTKEGVWIPDKDGTLKKSINNIEVVDLLCEGPIDGIVDQEFTYLGVLGHTGWDYVTHQPAIDFLSSIYLNGTPIKDPQGLYNFQNVQVRTSNGMPNGYNVGTNFLLDSDMQNASAKHWIGEGLDSNEYLFVKKEIDMNWANTLFGKPLDTTAGTQNNNAPLPPIRSNNSKFGAMSIYFPGTFNDSVPAQGQSFQLTDPDIGNEIWNLWKSQAGNGSFTRENAAKQQFTFECWGYFNKPNYENTIADYGVSYSRDGWRFTTQTSQGGTKGRLAFFNGTIYGPYDLYSAADGDIPVQTWVHLAVSFHNNCAAIFIDGVCRGTVKYEYGLGPRFNRNDPLIIGTGQHATGPARNKGGYRTFSYYGTALDNIRMSNTSRYLDASDRNSLKTPSFTPQQVGTDKNTMALLDGEAWYPGTPETIKLNYGLYPKDTSATQTPFLVNGSETIEHQTFCFQVDDGSTNVPDSDPPEAASFIDKSKVAAKLTLVQAADGVGLEMPEYVAGEKNELGNYIGIPLDTEDTTSKILQLRRGSTQQGTMRAIVTEKLAADTMVPQRRASTRINTAPEMANYAYDGINPWQLETWIWVGRDGSYGVNGLICALMGNPTRVEKNAYIWRLWADTNTHVYFEYISEKNGTFSVPMNLGIPTNLDSTKGAWRHLQIIISPEGGQFFVNGVLVNRKDSKIGENPMLASVKEDGKIIPEGANEQGYRFTIGGGYPATTNENGMYWGESTGWAAHHYTGGIYNIRILNGLVNKGAIGAGSTSDTKSKEGQPTHYDYLTVQQTYYSVSSEKFLGTTNRDKENNLIIEHNPINKEYTLRAQRLTPSATRDSLSGWAEREQNGIVVQEVHVTPNTRYTLSTKAGTAVQQVSLGFVADHGLLRHNRFSLCVWKAAPKPAKGKTQQPPTDFEPIFKSKMFEPYTVVSTSKLATPQMRGISFKNPGTDRKAPSGGEALELPFYNSTETTLYVGARLEDDNSTVYFDDMQLTDPGGFPVSKARRLNERLRGPTVDAKGNPAGDNYSPDMFAKKYRIINKHCVGATVNLKLSQLFYSNSKTGKTEDQTIKSIYISFQPLFNSAPPIGILKASKKLIYKSGKAISVDVIDPLPWDEPAVEDEIQGMVTDGFIKSYRLDFREILPFVQDDGNFYGWEIKVWRTEGESTDQKRKKTTFVDSLVEEYDFTMCYPNSAVSIQSFNAEYFSNVPTRAFDARLLQVKIPSNYNPISRTYHDAPSDAKVTAAIAGFLPLSSQIAGVVQGGTSPHLSPWDGTFHPQKVWTDNPAWCFYDLITNPRYGLGEHIPEGGFDKWTLYKIAQFCDVLVPDGMGGMEPRFTLNTIINSREDAYKVINDMASVFRGILYYAAGQIYAVQDSPKESVYLFTNANVEDGNFVYNTTASRDRHNVCVVRYNDKENFYKPSIEYVEDIDGIKENGIREQELTAFGCTSRGQALRLGKWLVYTESLEKETVAFKAGIEAAFLRPGDNIEVSDKNRLSSRRGGRTRSISEVPFASPFTATAERPQPRAYDVVVLDAELDPNVIDPNIVYELSLLTPTYAYDSYNVTNMNSADAEEIRRSQVQSFLFSGAWVERIEDYRGNYYTKIPLSGCIECALNGDPKDALYSTRRIDRENYYVSPHHVYTICQTGQEPVYAKTLTDADSVKKSFRVVDIVEEERQKYKISAVQNSAEKYKKLEEDLRYEEAGLYNSPTLKVPDSPAALALKIEALTPNTVDIKYSITPPIDTAGLSSYHVFMSEDARFPIQDFTGNYPVLFNMFTGSTASGQQFMMDMPLNQVITTGQDYVPDFDKRIAIVPAGGVTTKTFRPQESGEYAFRVFSANSKGQFSRNGKMSAIVVPRCNPIEDIQVENLRLSDDPSDINEAGTVEFAKSTFTGGSPEIWWDSSVNGSGAIDQSIAYRITIREQSSSFTVPAENIYFEVTGYRYNPLVQNPSGFVYVYDLVDNLVNTTGLRDFDVVVEAHTPQGVSSAGGSFGRMINPQAPLYTDESGYLRTNYINKDSYYYNTSGYDMLRLSNPSIDQPYLSASSVDCGDDNPVCTTQAITLDNKIKLTFNKNDYHTKERDVLGGYVYASPNDFPVSGVQGKNLSDFPTGIQRLHFNYNETIEVIPTGDMLLDGTAFIAYSLYDTFDQETNTIYLSDSPDNPIENPDFELSSLLPVSPTREVKLDDMNTVKKLIKGGAQSLEFSLPLQRQWHFINLEGSLQGKRVLFAKTIKGQNYIYQELSQINNWKVFINDIRVDQAENWISNPPSTKEFTFCENAENKSTDSLPIFNLQAKGMALNEFKQAETLTIRLEFEGTNIDFINFSAEVNYGRIN